MGAVGPQHMSALPAFFFDPDRACANIDTKVFFPGHGEGEASLHQARRICSACPVRVVCAEHAITDGTIHGVWGGTTYKQRRRIREQRARGAT